MRIGIWAAILALCAAASTAWAQVPRRLRTEKQEPDPQTQVSVRVVSVEPAAARPGERVAVTIRVAMEEGWHIYPAERDPGVGKKTVFRFEGAPLKIDGPIEEPEPHKQDLGNDIVSWIYEGTAEFKVPLRIGPDADPGPLEVRGQADVYLCSSICVDVTKDFAFELTVLEGRVEPAPAPVQPETPAEPSPQAEKEGGIGFWAFMMLCVGGGLLGLIQPCVYPMIPITISYFVKEGAGSRAKTVLLSQMYALGIVVTFTGLGLILAAVFGKGGAQTFAQNGWVNLTIALVFIAFALSLFGLFEMRLPSFLTQAATGKPKSGAGGAFLLGLAFAVVTFTCTIPIAGLILGFAALGKFAWAVPGMLAFSGTMAVPFLVLGMFPGLLARVPRGGGWLHEAKICGGFLELAIAVLYLAKADYAWALDLVTRDLGIVVWAVSMGFASLYLLGLFRWKEDAPVERVGFGRAATAGLFAVIGLMFYGGIGGRPLGRLEFLLPRDEVVEKGGPVQAVVEPVTERIERLGARLGALEEHLGIERTEKLSGPPERWLEDYDEARRIARDHGWPLFLDFSGFT